MTNLSVHVFCIRKYKPHKCIYEKNVCFNHNGRFCSVTFPRDCMALKPLCCTGGISGFLLGSDVGSAPLLALKLELCNISSTNLWSGLFSSCAKVLSAEHVPILELEKVHVLYVDFFFNYYFFFVSWLSRIYCIQGMKIWVWKVIQ